LCDTHPRGGRPGGVSPSSRRWRGYFAEFLESGWLVALVECYLSTGVGLEYGGGPGHPWGCREWGHPGAVSRGGGVGVRACRLPGPPSHPLSPAGHPLAGAFARALGAVSLNVAGQCVENLGLSAMVVAAPRGGPTKWCYSCRQCHFPSLHGLFQARFGELGNVLLPAAPRGGGAAMPRRRAPGVPLHLWCRAAETSELLRPLTGMAASKPTHLLSRQPDILSHWGAAGEP
jgi:hypothetical protein